MLFRSEFGGSFTELGSYTLLPIIKFFGTDFEKVTFDTIKADNGLDILTKAHFNFINGLGTATCGLGVKSEGQMIISGTKGYIIVEAPWWKTTYFEIHHENPEDVEKYSDRFLGDGLRYEVSDFLSLVNGSTECEFKLSREESIVMADIMERFLKENR